MTRPRPPEVKKALRRFNFLVSERHCWYPRSDVPNTEEINYK